MTDTKLRLSLSVRGAQLLSPQECGKNPKDSFDTTVIPVEFRTKKGNIQKENVVVKTRKQRLIKQSLNVSREAYNYMIDPQCPPIELSKKIIVTKVIGKNPNGKPIKVAEETTVWANRYNEKQRLTYHLDKLAASLGAVKYTYEIFED